MKLHYLLIGMACLGLQASNAQETIAVELPCFDTKVLFNELKNKYKETPIVMGITSDQVKSTMSVWLQPTTNTWTIVATKDSLSCIIGTGENFKIIPVPKESDS